MYNVHEKEKRRREVYHSISANTNIYTVLHLIHVLILLVDDGDPFRNKASMDTYFRYMPSTKHLHLNRTLPNIIVTLIVI